MTAPTTRAQAAISRVGRAGLFGFAATAWLSTSAAALALSLVVIAFIFNRSAWSTIRRDPVFVLFVATTVYIVLRAGWAAWELPETAAAQAQQASAGLKLWLFVCIAWWLGASLTRIHWVLLLALGGLIGGMLWRMDWSDFPRALWSNDRHAFGAHPNPYALYISTALLSLFTLAPRFLSLAHRSSLFALRLIGWATAILLLAQWLVTTNTRSAWLAVLLVFPPVLATRGYFWLREKPSETAKRLVVVGLAVAGLATIVAFNFSAIEQRLAADHEARARIAAGELENLPRTSIGYRMDLYLFGFSKWRERPMFGWGPGSTEYLISHSSEKERLRPIDSPDWFDHLHSTYLEILVRYGLLGAALFALIVVMLLRALYQAYCSRQLPGDYALFILGSFGLTAVWCAFDFRLDHFDWLHYWILLAGITYTFRLHSNSV